MGEEESIRAGRKGGLCGCLAAAGLAPLLGMVVLVGTLMSDCAPGDDCHSDDGSWLGVAALVIALIAAAFGMAVRALVRWAMVRRLGGRARVPWWAVAVLVPLAALALWCLAGIAPFLVAG